MDTPTPPTDVHAPLTAVSPLDQTGIIAILTGFTLGLILLSAGIRLYARRYAGVYRPDDFAFWIAVTFAIAQTALVFYLVSQGLGKAVKLLGAHNLKAIQRTELAGNLLYITVLALSKISCALMFLWLTPFQKHLAWFNLTASSLWLFASLLTEGFLHQEFPQYSSGSFNHWLYISIFDIVIELALIISSVYVVWNRQMSIGAKWTVVGAFACRGPNITCTIIRLIFLREPLTPDSSSYWTARVQSVTQLAIGYTVTACVIPYLRPLMQAYEPDGSRRSSSTAPNFKLSERSSKGSVGSVGRSGPWGLFRTASAPGRAQSATTYEPSFLNTDIVDVGGLITPQKAALKRTRSEDPESATVFTKDWSIVHGIRRDSVVPPSPVPPVTGTGSDEITPVPFSPGRARQNRGSDKDSDKSEAGNIV